MKSSFRREPFQRFAVPFLLSMALGLGAGPQQASSEDRTGMLSMRPLLVQGARPFQWNGTWGRRDGPGAGVVVRNERVRYYWNGSEVQIMNVVIAPREIRFRTSGSGRNVVLTPTSNGNVLFATSAPGEAPSSFEIFRN